MKGSMLANHLIALECVNADVDYATVSFDADGGTDAGLLTLVVDEDTTTVDLGDAANDTLDELIATLAANVDFYVFFPLGMNGAAGVKTTNFTQRPLADKTAFTAERGRVQKVIEFSTAYETMPASATTAFQTPILIDVSCQEEVSVIVSATGADAGATGSCSLVLATLSAEGVKTTPVKFDDSEDDFTNSPLIKSVDFDEASIHDDAVTVALSGASTVVENEVINVRGVDFLYAHSFTNADDAAVQVEVWVSK